MKSLKRHQSRRLRPSSQRSAGSEVGPHTPHSTIILNYKVDSSSDLLHRIINIQRLNFLQSDSYFLYLCQNKLISLIGGRCVVQNHLENVAAFWRNIQKINQTFLVFIETAKSMIMILKTNKDKMLEQFGRGRRFSCLFT